jgi:hypothetical protein
VYRIYNGVPVIINEVEAVITNETYFVTTAKESVPVPVSPATFTTMEEFYEMLRKDQGLGGDDVKIIKGVFDKEKIMVKQLPRLTDEKLEKYGLLQGGLREAILAVLRK